MKLFDLSKISFFFKCSCIIATIIIVFHWIFVYIENEDVSHIEVQSVETMKNIAHPELNICLIQPFLDEKLTQISAEMNRNGYLSYMIGKSNKTDIYKLVDFDNVTIDLVEYLFMMNFIWKNGSFSTCNGNQFCPFGSFKNNLNLIVRRDIFIKCFGFETNHYHTKQLNGINILFKSTLLNIVRNINDITVSLNYPKQRLSKVDPGNPIWHNYLNTYSKEVITIQMVEILERRNTIRNPCVPQEINYDEFVVQRKLEQIGCKTPYHTATTFENISICESQKKMKEAAFDAFSAAHGNPPPCRTFSGTFSSSTEANEAFAIKEHPGELSLIIWYADKVKVITQLRQIDAQALIGYIGGYIGFILGKILMEAKNFAKIFLF